MIALYIIAGAITGFFSTGLLAMFSCVSDGTPTLVRFLLAFVGGVGGHCLFTLINS